MAQQASRLIAHVLYPDELAKQAVIEMAQSHPSVFIVSIQEIKDHVKDLDGNHRFYVNWSAYQLLFLGDIELLACVKPHLDAYLDKGGKFGGIVHDHEFARQHILKKFPDGFDFPPCTDEFKKALNSWTQALINDQQLQQTKIPSQATKGGDQVLQSYVTSTHGRYPSLRRAKSYHDTICDVVMLAYRQMGRKELDTHM